jgi:hypothetical protein
LRPEVNPDSKHASDNFQTYWARLLLVLLTLLLVSFSCSIASGDLSPESILSSIFAAYSCLSLYSAFPRIPLQPRAHVYPSTRAARRRAFQEFWKIKLKAPKVHPFPVPLPFTCDVDGSKKVFWNPAPSFPKSSEQGVNFDNSCIFDGLWAILKRNPKVKSSCVTKKTFLHELSIGQPSRKLQSFCQILHHFVELKQSPLLDASKSHFRDLLNDYATGDETAVRSLWKEFQKQHKSTCPFVWMGAD